MTILIFGTVLPWLLVAAGTWLGYQVVRQNGRILARLEAIERRLSPRGGGQPRQAGGLPVGTLAPDFELPDLTGVRHKLSDFRDKNLLLIFFNPQCGFCTRMAADLAALPVDGGGDRPIPVVITTGDAGENRKLVEKYGIRCVVLLQKEMEFASQYRARGTPMGYRIDGAGRIGRELTVGAEPLLQLAAGIAPRRQDEPDAPLNGSAPSGLKDYRSLAGSRLNRSGLKAGAPAPDFRLPRIDGGDLSLADLRGGRVLLVFSDPDCGPCDELAPRLQQVHLQRPNLQVIVVSRRDAEATRTKAAALRLSFPIVLQRQWEISLLYAMFATPVGYLIDEQGILASDVAVGIGPILALVDEPSAGIPASAGASVSGKEPAWAN
ncbi:MAG: peroxiredoxin family protein [Deltaproteobacteria bacterium]